MAKIPVALTVNGQRYDLEVEANRLLLDVLREDLGLLGTKETCREGECGACTVLVDGKALNSCLLLAAYADGKRVTTVEGLKLGGKLHPLQEAFARHGAVQCGYCTPGFLMSAKALLDENADPSEAEIRAALAGNICRCTGYNGILDAVQAAAAALRTVRRGEGS